MNGPRDSSRSALGFLSVLLCVLLGQSLEWIRPVAASDHADPIFLRHLEAGITDLFAFEDEDHLVLLFACAATSPMVIQSR